MKNKLILISAMLALLAGCQTAPQTQMPAGWKEVTGDGAFSVSMPGTPHESTKTAPVNSGSVALHLFVVDKGKSRYMFAYNDFKSNMEEPQIVGTILDVSAKGITSALHGKLESENNISLQNHPGRELKIALPDGERLLRCRIFAVGNRVYYAEVSMPVAEYDSKDILTFLNSFKLK